MALLTPSLETLRRKLMRSLAQRGLLSTLRRCVSRPLQMMANVTRSVLPQQRRILRQELEFDQHCNVDTRADRDPGWMAAITSPNWMHGIGYAPVPFADLRTILKGLDLSWQDYTFVDLGAGKGRALFVAAEFPFHHVTGVEYSPRLAAALTNNIASYRNPRQRCWSLAGLLGDATEYPFPTDPLVLFFHHPFETIVFRQVLARLELSLARHPRHIVAIYYDPQCEQVFAESASFQRLMQAPLQPGSTRANWVVYEANPALCGAASSGTTDRLAVSRVEGTS
jgi:SAM-dependent methyltransferase